MTREDERLLWITAVIALTFAVVVLLARIS